MNKNKEKMMEIKLMDGTTLSGAPRIGGAVDWPSKKVQSAEAELFVRNAHFLFANRVRVFSDSRLFLTPVRIISGMAYTGRLPMPCLGGYLEWWLHSEQASRGEGDERELVYVVSGSALSGASASMAVRADGTRRASGASLLALADSFGKVMRRYSEPMASMESFTLEEALDILKGRPPAFEHSLERIILEQRVKAQAHEMDELKKAVALQDARIKAYEKALVRAVVREHPEDVRKALEQAEANRKDGAAAGKGRSADRPVTMLFREFAKREGIVLSAPSRRFLMDELAKTQDQPRP